MMQFLCRNSLLLLIVFGLAGGIGFILWQSTSSQPTHRIVGVHVDNLTWGGASTSPPRSSQAPVESSFTVDPQIRRESGNGCNIEIPSLEPLQFFRRATEKIVFLKSSKVPKSDEEMCELAVIATHNCFIEEEKENFLECLGRIGANVLGPLLSVRCTRSKYFKTELLPKYSVNLSESEVMSRRKCLRRSITSNSQIDLESGPPYSYVPPFQRIIPSFAPPKTCSVGCKVYPISFAAPEEDFVPRVSRLKLFDFVPGTLRKPYMFKYSDEALYRTLIEMSLFGFTERRGGWDCMRHYEYFMSGTVPYFVDLPLCHNMCLTALPKLTLLDVLKTKGVDHVGKLDSWNATISNAWWSYKPDPNKPKNAVLVRFHEVPSVNKTFFDENAYFHVADSLLQYSKRNLTTRSLVAYILRTMNFEEPRNVLFIQFCEPWGMDYLEGSIEHGLASLGIKYSTNCPRPAMFKYKPKDIESLVSEEELNHVRRYRTSKAYGFGFSLGMRVANRGRRLVNDSEVIESLARGEYDVAFYGVLSTISPSSLPFWKQVSSALPRDRIAFFQRDDDNGESPEQLRLHCKEGFFFKRELYDDPC